MIVVWGVTRIYALPLMIYEIFNYVKYDPEFAQFQPFIMLHGIFLSVMCFLHYYWFCLFFKMIYGFAVTGEAKDAQNDVSAGRSKVASPRKSAKAEKIE